LSDNEEDIVATMSCGENEAAGILFSAGVFVHRLGRLADFSITTTSLQG
jgi:hypothetical protein